MTESLRCSDSFLCWLVVGSVFFRLCCASFPSLSLSLYIIKANCVFFLPLYHQAADCFQTGFLCFLQIYSYIKHMLNTQSNWVAWLKHQVAVLNTLYSIYAYKISKTIVILYHIFWRASICISLTVFVNLILIAGSKQIFVLLRFKDGSEISQ